MEPLLWVGLCIFQAAWPDSQAITARKELAGAGSEQPDTEPGITVESLPGFCSFTDAMQFPSCF